MSSQVRESLNELVSAAEAYGNEGSADNLKRLLRAREAADAIVDRIRALEADVSALSEVNCRVMLAVARPPKPLSPSTGEPMAWLYVDWKGSTKATTDKEHAEALDKNGDPLPLYTHVRPRMRVTETMKDVAAKAFFYDPHVTYDSCSDAVKHEYRRRAGDALDAVLALVDEPNGRVVVTLADVERVCEVVCPELTGHPYSVYRHHPRGDVMRQNVRLVLETDRAVRTTETAPEVAELDALEAESAKGLREGFSALHEVAPLANGGGEVGNDA